MNYNLSYEEFKSDPELLYDFINFFFSFKPYEYQKNFLKSCLLKNRVAGNWCRQSGKSQTVAVYTTFRSIIKPTVTLIVAPTLTQSSELYSKIRNLVATNDFIGKLVIRDTQTELTFNNGSRIKALPSGESGRTIRGFTADVVIVEEAGIFDDNIISSVVTPMLASKGKEGQLIKIGTPLKRNHFYKSCFEDTNYDVVFVSYEDCLKAGQYDKEFIEEQKRVCTDTQFRTEYMCEFIDETAGFFPLKLIEDSMVTFPQITI